MRFLFLLLLRATLALSEPSMPTPGPGPGPTPTPTPLADPEIKETKKGGHSVAPIVGYEPTYKFVAGAAYFYEGESTSLGLDLYTNFHEVYQNHVRLYYPFYKPWSVKFYLAGIKGFDPYYGEGGNTSPQNLIQLWGSRFYTELRLEYALSHLVTLSVITDFRLRTEDSHQDPTWQRSFPDERRFAAGIGFDLDSTQPRKQPKNGFRFLSKLLFSPENFSSLDRHGFTIAEGNLAVYQAILTELSSDIVAAYRVKGGYSFGDPTYMFRFRLGGSDGLAGYFDNRFRGKFYYAQSTEIRYPIWKLFSGAFSLGFGDITDDDFGSPKMAYGLGLRIGLPPDWVSKVRIDFLFGKDQQGVFVDFGDTF